MAADDIRVCASPHGGGESCRAFPMGASATFVRGEPVVLTAGALDECATDPPFVTGIAGTRATDADGNALATGTPIPVAEFTDTQSFYSYNFATDGAGTADVPTQANAIGVLAGLTLVAGSWFVDTGAANLILEITDVRNNVGVSVANPNLGTVSAGTSVVFKVVT